MASVVKAEEDEEEEVLECLSVREVHYGKMHGGGAATEEKNRNDKKRDFNNITEAYMKRLTEGYNMNRTRILAFMNKPSKPIEAIPSDLFELVQQLKPIKARRHIPRGSSNVLPIALANIVYLWDATDGNTSELVTVDDESDPLYDSTTNKLLRTMRGGHQPRVEAMDWNNHILTTGGMDGHITNNDVRKMNLMRPYKRYESLQRLGRLIGVDVSSRWLGLAVSDLHYQFAIGDVSKVLCQDLSQHCKQTSSQYQRKQNKSRKRHTCALCEDMGYVNRELCTLIARNIDASTHVCCEAALRNELEDWMLAL
ncbi:cell division cycle 20.2, cofactor of APC complex-like protein [Tanacetum coccineum]